MTRPFSPADIVVTRWGARFMGRRFPCSIGKGGITDTKREGDGASPRANLTLPALYYRADRIFPLHGNKIGPRDLWCDAADHPAYNHLTRAPLKASHERMRRADRLYDLVLITDWNWPDATPGKGSAIFVHRWRKPRHPTEGCVAFRADHLRWIAERATPRTRLIIR
ncbi:L,D-transpeptidase family protein [Celeribacter halophilus]|uniref:L,D-peptidoglycan transpeptidase YkuD, ErfK/YbiS/YcfS/YnhG family n=1 Tax=Celeribacter halophilus TaxID=576117 RepID=A0A1I3SZ66_9RHOB|nr:L,D-transpeptidase family protein [Celeribacter halophilus]PZX12000.1 L,D-peptidoglycan transpeptidase YkuD (ErfK/YbiS/YcfS/YnhG family) [Celeribacter halophilus]SFJ64148.1 L,D-peptidoglycan transpeptidase YkuD, ErfK/YbiS/YcfS/YnhG family [Celeribacter halophilus]